MMKINREKVTCEKCGGIGAYIIEHQPTFSALPSEYIPQEVVNGILETLEDAGVDGIKRD